jgi:hypothetical protein
LAARDFGHHRRGRAVSRRNRALPSVPQLQRL